MAEPGEYRTTYLGQFADETAELVAEALEDAGIDWYHKRSGSIARWFFVGEWGVRIFVDARRIEDARRVVERVIADERETG